jgi:hypothetical protein
MGLMDKFEDMKEKARNRAGEHPDKVDEAVDKGKDFADEKIGGKYSEQIDQGADRIREQTENYTQR